MTSPIEELPPSTERDPEPQRGAEPGELAAPWPDEQVTAVEVPHPPTTRGLRLVRSSVRCRCGEELARGELTGPEAPWLCAALLLGVARPGTAHDERTAEALAPRDQD